MTSFRLILQTEPGSGTEYILDKPELFLGRDPGNDIVINDPEISRRHARLLLTGNTYTIEDLGSTNGTFIRGQRLSIPVNLRPGEIISLGDRVKVRFEVTGLGTDATVASYRPTAQPTQTPPAAQVPPFISPTPAQPSTPVSTPRPINIPPVQQAAPVHIPPVAPVGATPQVVTPAKKKKSGWLVALLVVLAVIVVFCVIPWLIIELTNSYCALFPGIFNAIQPGVCP